MRQYDPQRMIFIWGAEARCRVRSCPVTGFWIGFGSDKEGFFLVTNCPLCGQKTSLSKETKEKIELYDKARLNVLPESNAFKEPNKGEEE